MPTKSKILFSLYQRLKLSPCSIPQLRLWKQANSYDISDRTLYRYLHELDIVIAEKFGEMLEIIQNKGKRKYWKISSIDAVTNGLQSSDFPEHQQVPVPIQYNFGQAIVTRETGGAKEMVLSAIEAGAQLTMDTGITVAHEEVFPGDLVLPLKVIRHQCMDHLCFYHERNRKIQTAPINSLGRVSFEGGHFSPDPYLHKLNEFFVDHFGLAPNLDDSIYPVELIFSESTAKMVMNYHWHPSQRFHQLDNGDVQMTMHCGVNEDLIQWVLKFADQVAVAKPQLLIDKVISQCTRVIQRYPARRGSERLQIAS
ncbi:MAG TPA: WYL domain-containing protein [Flavitalea sp.]|nr:WYL domain-containing protein [Flavitalea sp.]